MKTIKNIFKVLRWFVAILIILFSVATLMNKSYGPTLTLVLIATLLVFWPVNIEKKLNSKISTILRVLSIVLLIIVKQTVFKSEPKSSIYKSEQNRRIVMAIYNDCMEKWPSDTKERFIITKYGKVHVLECGNKDKPPLVMFHAASMGAHSWAENLGPILDQYHIYSFDNPGEGNKSELHDALVFPSSPKELADLYNTLLNELNIDSAIVFGASNGGFIAQNLAYYYPEKVLKLALFGPMGLTQLTKGSIAMMGLSTMYPFQYFRNAVSNWAIGTDPVCHQEYGDWFNAIMKGTIPSIAGPIPMSTEQKNSVKLPILLFLGTKDKIVGDAQKAKDMAQEYPNIQIEILESGHLIAVEHSEKVNETILTFLK